VRILPQFVVQVICLPIALRPPLPLLLQHRCAMSSSVGMSGSHQPSPSDRTAANAQRRRERRNVRGREDRARKQRNEAAASSSSVQTSECVPSDVSLSVPVPLVGSLSDTLRGSSHPISVVTAPSPQPHCISANYPRYSCLTVSARCPGNTRNITVRAFEAAGACLSHAIQRCHGRENW